MDRPYVRVLYISGDDLASFDQLYDSFIVFTNCDFDIHMPGLAIMDGFMGWEVQGIQASPCREFQGVFCSK